MVTDNIQLRILLIVIGFICGYVFCISTYTEPVTNDFIVRTETVMIEKECPVCEEITLSDCLNMTLDAQKQLSEVDIQFRRKRLIWS